MMEQKHVAVSTLISLDLIETEENDFPPLPSLTIQRLKKSIARDGILVPLHVSLKENGRYNLEDGFHRLQAAKDLGLKSVPAILVEPTEDKLKAGDVLNIVRRHMTPEEIADWDQALSELDCVTEKNLPDDFEVIIRSLDKIYDRGLKEEVLDRMANHPAFEHLMDYSRSICASEVDKEDTKQIEELYEEKRKQEKKINDLEKEKKDLANLLQKKDKTLSGLRMEIDAKKDLLEKTMNKYNANLAKLESENATEQLKKELELANKRQIKDLEKEIENLRKTAATAEGDKESANEKLSKANQGLRDIQAVVTVLKDNLKTATNTIQKLKATPDISILDNHWKLIDSEIKKVNQILIDFDWPETLEESLGKWVAKAKKSLDTLVSDFESLISSRTKTDLVDIQSKFN